MPHPPEPWTVERGESYVNIVAADGTVVVDQYYATDKQGDQYVLWFRLLAAAPKMFRLLKELFYLLEGEDQVWDAACEDAEELINKLENQ